MTPILPLPESGLSLVPFTEVHLTDRYVSWLNDPHVVRFSENRHRRHTLESCRTYYEGMHAGGNFFWAAVLDDGRHVGNLTAYVDIPNAVADLAIVIGERATQGKGIGKAAWRGACDFLLSAGRMRKVTAGTMSVNQPMLGVMRAAGMVEEGRRKAQFLFEGLEVDLVMAALFRRPGHA